MRGTESPFSARETVAIRRMLAAFERDLPPHELGRWLITNHSEETSVLENEGPPHRHYAVYDHGYLRIRGYAECLRCNRRFDIPDIGNFITTFDRIDHTVATAKEWVARIAEKNGPCWGDVPQPPREDWGYAVLD